MFTTYNAMAESTYNDAGESDGDVKADEVSISLHMHLIFVTFPKEMLTISFCVNSWRIPQSLIHDVLYSTLTYSNFYLNFKSLILVIRICWIGFHDKSSDISSF